MRGREWVCAAMLGLSALAQAQPQPQQAQFQQGMAAARRGDYAAALAAWRPLAERGNSNAQNNVGVFYERGEGVPRDYVAAVSWYRRAAEQGNGAAQNNLGVMYEKGLGV